MSPSHRDDLFHAGTTPGTSEQITAGEIIPGWEIPSYEVAVRDVVWTLVVFSVLKCVSWKCVHFMNDLPVYLLKMVISHSYIESPGGIFTLLSSPTS